MVSCPWVLHVSSSCFPGCSKCRQGVAPPYLADEFCQPADTEARCHLHSASTSSLTVRRTRLSTVGYQVFPVAAPRIWNSLLQHVTSAVTGHLSQSPQDSSLQALLSMISLFSCCARKVTCHYGHVNRFCYLLTYWLYWRVSFRMTLSDLEWLSEIFNDTKRRVVRQLSYLSAMVRKVEKWSGIRIRDRITAKS